MYSAWLIAAIALAAVPANGQPYAPTPSGTESIFGSLMPPVARFDPAAGPDLAQPDAPADALPDHLRRRVVEYAGHEAPGTVIIDTPNTALYYVLGGGRAIRYAIGVGREGFTWSGVQTISRKAEWPDWIPPREMIARQPYLPRFVAGGPTNPLGARALYLGNTMYRIHGTNDPSTIGGHVSSGCIRMTNDDVIDLYERVGIGTRVVVLPMSARARPALQQSRGEQAAPRTAYAGAAQRPATPATVSATPPAGSLADVPLDSPAAGWARFRPGALY
jgi:lipoprotein-anchoring transpeptidase ErfK/SrfK